MDEVEGLISLIGQAFGPEAAANLKNLRDAADNARNAEDWNDKVHGLRQRYSELVRNQQSIFIPQPILALPGAREFVNTLLTRALDEGERAVSGAAKDIMLGPAAASLNLQAVMLPPPLGLANLRPALIGFKPPTGLMLTFGDGPASGGGALDYQVTPRPRLSGALGLKLSIAQVSALSILESEVGGYSLLTLLSARFAPGIQVGFGFAISGIGGLIGINRATDAGALEAQFRTSALVNALFGDTSVANPTGTLATLSAVFQFRMGAHVFGPSTQLSWLKTGDFTLFNVDLGVFMQLPGPSRVDLIGSARAGIPLIFQLRLDVRGELDFARRVVGLHAVIVDSYVMGVFKLQGEAIFRMRYGDDPYVVLTIGGFFPGFNPAPAELPAHIQRIGMGLDLPIKLPIYLRATGYLAVTSNTLQFGAHLEAGFDAGLFGAEGHFILDALFQFDPFRFEVRFAAGFHIKVLGKSFSGVDCSGVISGPGPVVVLARISYKTPFFLPNINWSETFTIGRTAPRIERMADLFQELGKELTAANLRAENGDDPHVVLKVKGATVKELALLAPLGDLVWMQRLAPLGLELERLNNTPLAQPEGARVAVTNDAQDSSSAPRERFNLSMYRDLSDAERMNLATQVEEHVAGLRYRHGMRSGADDTLRLEFQEFRRPEWSNLPSPTVMAISHALLAKVGERSSLADVSNTEPRVSTVREEWHAGGQSFDTQAGAHIAAQKQGRVAHLAMDVVDIGGV
jgi:hypothetical protein